MPARHWSPQREFASADFNVKALIDERGCRRDIRSTAGSYFDEKPVRQKKQVFFVRCGSPRAPQFHRASRPNVKSGPDVFADALVPKAGASAAWRFRFPQSQILIWSSTARGLRSGRVLPASSVARHASPRGTGSGEPMTRLQRRTRFAAAFSFPRASSNAGSPVPGRRPNSPVPCRNGYRFAKIAG
jgi:hypothetical protein